MDANTDTFEAREEEIDAFAMKLRTGGGGSIPKIR